MITSQNKRFVCSNTNKGDQFRGSTPIHLLYITKPAKQEFYNSIFLIYEYEMHGLPATGNPFCL
jgi:hypothetical protein